MKKNNWLWATFILGLLAIFPIHQASADWQLLPESRHQLFDSWGLFIDEQTILVNYGQARTWVGLGGTIPLYGNRESPHHPTFLMHASANAALHYSENFRIWTETMDARLGFTFEFEITPTLRFSVGYTHFSGHTADGVSLQDTDLIEPSVGQEFIPIRIVTDLDRKWRLSTTLKPVARSYPPPTYPIWFDQSVEFFPWGGEDGVHSFSPYISIGLEEWGIKNYTVTYHVQVGAYVGNHFSGGHHQTLRLVAGFYTGADPRIKYFEIRNATMSFGYLGAMFDL